ncbi:GntR family transcriptional regulator (plasmid) [Paracoccus alcaliphilus]|nr:GntR family transcriptional regulator [Paracoccus alcaliphilus]
MSKRPNIRAGVVSPSTSSILGADDDAASGSIGDQNHIRLGIAPLVANPSLRDLAYDAIKNAITGMDIYGSPEEFRLDERQLSQDLGVSRTPIREALTILEQEGFVRTVPRRGVFVVRLSKQQIIERITVWAALESMAAYLAADRASARELRMLRKLFEEFERAPDSEHMHEYSEANINFHQTIIRLGDCQLLAEMSANLLIHVRAIRNVSLRQDNRAERSLSEHMQIIDALEARNGELAAQLVRQHTLGLAAHVDKHGLFS